jgi:phospholipase/carboxylesterase
MKGLITEGRRLPAGHAHGRGTGTTLPQAAARRLSCGAKPGRRLATLAVAFALPALVARLPSAADAAGLTYVVHAPAGKAPHPPLIVLLHGSGADERDMISLWTQLPGDFVVVSPRAPFADGTGGYRWYRRPMAGRAADVAISRTIVDTLIDDAARRFDADPKRIFVGGFSQGAVMAYDIALKEPGRFRGAAILSGSLFPGDAKGRPAGAGPTRVAFFIGHGTADNRIPFAAATAARAALDRLGVPVSFHAYPGMRHETGAREIDDLGRWLADRSAVDPASPQ